MSTGDDGKGSTGGSLIVPCRLPTSISPHPPYVAGAAVAASAAGGLQEKQGLEKGTLDE
ncbi:hypothetical protein LCGC14_2232470 [marine sediment metagenome]|uniref:Uncharacterized protein n=1 Tax=marine sediment metagenome TaxID=412755 RepID=A0A0F9DVG2_9ZZZZ